MAFSKESSLIKLLELSLDPLQLLVEEDVPTEVKVVLMFPSTLLDLAHVVISITELRTPAAIAQC